MALAEHAPDRVILDVGLPDCNGFDWCKALRTHSTVQGLFLTARNSEIDRVVELEIGGDDYVVKPFSPREVTSRVRAILRRGLVRSEADAGARETEQSDEFLRIDEGTFEAVYCDQRMVQTRYEFRLLNTLAKQPGRCFRGTR